MLAAESYRDETYPRMTAPFAMLAPDVPREAELGE